jgi:hypothetical protein
MAFLAAETFRLDHGNALEAYFLESFFDFIELEGLDDGFDLLHPGQPFSFEVLPLLAPARRAFHAFTDSKQPILPS